MVEVCLPVQVLQEILQVFLDQGGGTLQKLGGGCWCGCDAQPHALVLASHPWFSKWREILKQSFDICRHCIWNWLHLVGAKTGKSGGGGWVLDGLVSLIIKTGWFHLMDTIR
jgi:hypothetical protein